MASDENDWQPGDPVYQHVGCTPQPMIEIKTDQVDVIDNTAARWTPNLGWY
jgi:hypothetical protein